MARSLKEAIKEVLSDDNKISKFEARVIRELATSDGVVSQEEKEALEKALSHDEFDDKAFGILQALLLRSILSN
jgi:hypothetical protein